MNKKMLIYKVICTLVIIAAAILLLTGVFNKKDSMYHLADRSKIGPLTKEDVSYRTVAAPTQTLKDGTIGAEAWKEIYPYITQTMYANADNAEIISYLEQDPYLVQIYEGYGFAKDYGSARGHAYTLEDVHNTQRPHATANCLTCKSPSFTKMVQDQGVGVYTKDFEEVYNEILANGEVISCYTCHGNDAGSKGALRVTHTYVNKALGENVSTIDPATLSCGQCHIEYYFTNVDSDGDGNPDSEAMMPYHSVEEMTPEAILAYYDGIAGKDGEPGFYDWIQEATGTKMLKAQHPEMETYLQSVHAQNGLSCADCHMAIEMQEDGTVNHSHELVSPLASQTILSTCVQCHGSTNMVEKVHRIQDAVTARETVIGNKLAAFKNAFADALSAGNLSEQKIATLHKLHREAQWFFDFCYVENSEGAHNSALANHCLDVAEEKITEGMALLGEG